MVEKKYHGKNGIKDLIALEQVRVEFVYLIS